LEFNVTPPLKALSSDLGGAAASSAPLSSAGAVYGEVASLVTVLCAVLLAVTFLAVGAGRRRVTTG
jgi:hypothetical protein